MIDGLDVNIFRRNFIIIVETFYAYIFRTISHFPVSIQSLSLFTEKFHDGWMDGSERGCTREGRMQKFRKAKYISEKLYARENPVKVRGACFTTFLFTFLFVSYFFFFFKIPISLVDLWFMREKGPVHPNNGLIVRMHLFYPEERYPPTLSLISLFTRSTSHRHPNNSYHGSTDTRLLIIRFQCNTLDTLHGRGF